MCLPWDGEESHRVLPKLAPEPGRGCDRLFFGPGLYWRHNKGRGRNVGNIPGSGYFAQFFCGLSAAYGDKPPFRVPPVSRSVCLGGSPGSGVQRRLPAAGIFLPGGAAVADGESGGNVGAGLWVESERLEAGRRLCAAESGPGRRGNAVQPGESGIPGAGSGGNLDSVPDSVRQQRRGAGICTGDLGLGGKPASRCWHSETPAIPSGTPLPENRCWWYPPGWDKGSPD